MKRKTTRSSDTLRCPACGRRTRHAVRSGQLQHDPKHPEDRRLDFRRVTYRCQECGRTEHRQQLPNLLVDIFHT
jgi:DNA-directed RNA polymerase subunit RPC12/RpoP